MDDNLQGWAHQLELELQQMEEGMATYDREYSEKQREVLSKYAKAKLRCAKCGAWISQASLDKGLAKRHQGDRDNATHHEPDIYFTCAKHSTEE